MTKMALHIAGTALASLLRLAGAQAACPPDGMEVASGSGRHRDRSRSAAAAAARFISGARDDRLHAERRHRVRAH